MKKIIAAVFSICLSFSSLAIAEESGERMAEFKQKMAQHIDKEIEILTQFKACVQAAQKRTDFDACKNARNDAQQKKMTEMKKERLENRKKRLAAEEKQLGDAAKPDKK